MTDYITIFFSLLPIVLMVAVIFALFDLLIFGLKLCLQKIGLIASGEVVDLEHVTFGDADITVLRDDLGQIVGSWQAPPVVSIFVERDVEVTR